MQVARIWPRSKSICFQICRLQIGEGVNEYVFIQFLEMYTNSFMCYGYWKYN